MRSGNTVARILGIGALASAALCGTLRATGPAPAAAPRRPNTYGTVQTTYYAIDVASFSLVASDLHYACINNCQLRYVSDATSEAWQAPVHLPGGAVVISMEIDYYDGSSGGEVSASLATCNSQGVCTFASGACASDTVCSGVPDTPGYSSSAADLSAEPVVIDNVAHRYFLVAGNGTMDGSTAISQVILGYVLQVSAPPGPATFSDVPATHPLFAYIEALAASGITGGCGGGHFCPDAPLTRGQMAVFLAKALGLQWP